MQDTTRVALAGHASSMDELKSYAVDPASFPAGQCVSMGSDGLPSLLKSAGFRFGVSKGTSLSDHKKTAILLTGKNVSIRATLKRASGVVTISSYANLVSGTDDALTVAGTAFTAQAGAVTPGGATFQAATSNAATATSLAAQINAHATVSLVVYAIVTSSGVVTIYSVVEGVGSTATGNDIGLTYTDNDSNIGITLSGLTSNKLSGGSATYSDIAYATVGSKMYINDITGKADIGLTGVSTITDAVYVAAPKIGIMEDGSEVAAVIVDMQGSL